MSNIDDPLIWLNPSKAEAMIAELRQNLNQETAARLKAEQLAMELKEQNAELQYEMARLQYRATRIAFWNVDLQSELEMYRKGKEAENS